MWGGPRSHRDDSQFSNFFGFCSPFGSSSIHDYIFGSALGAGSHAHAAHGRRIEEKSPAVERKLPCSLEELYNGTTKKMNISRGIVDASGSRTTQEEEILTIDVKPGWKKGTKITLTEKGNKGPHVIPADVVFVIDEKPHPVFTRDGDDLVATLKITLAEALTGCTVHPATIDGRILTVPIRSVIHPRHEEVVRGEGMPFPKDPSRKGNLRIRFDIEFPAVLTVKQKSIVRRLFGPQRTNMINKDGHGENKVVDDNHIPCLVPQAVTTAATHGENSRAGRVVYIGSFAVCVD